MRRDIKVGTKTLTLEINALTPILYRKVFKTDFIREMQAIRSGKNSEGLAEFFPKVAFIGFSQNEYNYKMTEEDFYKWLSDFGSLDFMNAAPDILSLIVNQEESTSKQKNL